MNLVTFKIMYKVFTKIKRKGERTKTQEQTNSQTKTLRLECLKHMIINKHLPNKKI